MRRTVAIVGSGLTAIAAARRLVERGCRPVILDVGLKLDPKRAAAVDRMAGQARSEWATGDLALVTENPTVHDPRPKRLAFGSPYVYTAGQELLPTEGPDSSPRATFVRGGFSTVWGASVLPGAACDLADWPIGVDDLEPHYAGVLDCIPLCGSHDGLERFFPLHTSRPQPLRLPGLAERLLTALERARRLRNDDDLAFGRARVLVRTASEPGGGGCVYCGHCLSGCVYGAIYTAEIDLLELVAAGQVDYRPGTLVERVEERAGQVTLACRDLAGERFEQVVDRVLLAAGAMATTRLVLESKGLYREPVAMKSTQGLILPLLHWRGVKQEWPDQNTLSAVFLELKVAGSEHWVHVQLTTPNELVMARLDYRPGGRRLRDRLLSPVFDRMLVAQANVHSDHAGSHLLTLFEGAEGEPGRLVIETEANPEYRRIARRVTRRLTSILARVGTVPVLPFVTAHAKPWGWHFGGSLPMSPTPRAPLDTDTLGRPVGWTRIHAIDSSTFPSLPATTVGLLAMANARRVADSIEI